MRQQCINAVEAALGRSLNQGEAADIENAIKQAMRSIAMQDRAAWQAMTTSDRLLQAAKRVGDDLNAAFAKKKQRLALDILAERRIQADIDANPTLPILAVLNRMLVAFNDGKSYVQSVESQAMAIADLARSELLGLIEASKGKFLGLVNDAVMNRDIVRELHGTDTGNAAAKLAAQQFKAVAEKLRERFNRAGGEVGKLEDWAMPHSHSSLRVGKAGRDQWVQDTLPLLNREKYVKEDGTLMSDAEVVTMLEEAHTTISTDGANQIEAGQYTGVGRRANRGSESRSLHFKDGDAWLEYQAKYGDRDLMQTLLGHIDGVSRDIALVERFGTNPNQMFNMFLDKGEKAQKLAGEDVSKVDAFRRKTEVLYAEVTRSNVPASITLAEKFAAYRALNVASRLGSATLSSITDGAMSARTAWVHGMAYHRVFGQELKLLNPLSAADREVARSVGLGVNELLASLNRYNDDGLTTSATWAGKVAKFSNAAASAVMRASALNALTAARKQAFSMMLMDKYGTMSRSKSWDDLAESDRSFLEQTGIKKNDWLIWQLAKPLDRGDGSLILSAHDIMRIPDADLLSIGAKGNLLRLREQAATRYMAHILDEQGMAVIEAGARERAKLYGSTEKGTWQGEMVRSMLQFKSFTAAIMMRHGGRMMGRKGMTSRAAYGVPLFFMASLLGGLVVQLRQIVQGNDPQDITNFEFLRDSILAGGAVGIYGDIFKGGMTPDGRGLADLIGGPIMGDIVGVAKVGNRAVREAAGDEKANAGNEAIKLAKSHIPAANLWYTRAATDHMIFNQLQEIANPGYLRRKEMRDKKKYDRTSWWSPDDVLPEDSPDWEKAVGQ